MTLRDTVLRGVLRQADDPAVRADAAARHRAHEAAEPSTQDAARARVTAATEALARRGEDVHSPEDLVGWLAERVAGTRTGAGPTFDVRPQPGQAMLFWSGRTADPASGHWASRATGRPDCTVGFDDAVSNQFVAQALTDRMPPGTSATILEQTADGRIVDNLRLDNDSVQDELRDAAQQVADGRPEFRTTLLDADGKFDGPRFADDVWRDGLSVQYGREANRQPGPHGVVTQQPYPETIYLSRERPAALAGRPRGGHALHPPGPPAGRQRRPDSRSRHRHGDGPRSARPAATRRPGRRPRPRPVRRPDHRTRRTPPPTTTTRPRPHPNHRTRRTAPPTTTTGPGSRPGAAERATPRTGNDRGHPGGPRRTRRPRRGTPAGPPAALPPPDPGRRYPTGPDLRLGACPVRPGHPGRPDPPPTPGRTPGPRRTRLPAGPPRPGPKPGNADCRAGASGVPREAIGGSGVRGPAGGAVEPLLPGDGGRTGPVRPPAARSRGARRPPASGEPGHQHLSHDPVLLRRGRAVQRPAGTHQQGRDGGRRQ